tara:strand:- start:37393 stop:39549 length:2157 start_codon:yes stop_codon:yes gene_type:complete
MYEAGGIKYTIEADAAELLQAEALIDKSLDKQSKAFKEADRQVRAYEKTQKDLGRTITSSGVVMDKNNTVLVDQTKRYRELATSANMNHASMVKMTATAQGVNTGLRNMSSNMSNVSYQIQDIAVQAQMGMNPFMIAAQQLPQMLVGMGAAAAGIGAVIAILGGVATAYIDTSSSADKLAKSIGNIKAAITLSKDGVISYTEEMERLGRVSEEVANFKLKLLAVEARDAMKEGVSAIADEFSNLNDGDIFTNFNDAIEYSDQLMMSFSNELGGYAKFIGEQLGHVEKDAKKMGAEFIRTVKALQTAESVQEVDNLQSKLVEMAGATGKSTIEIQKLLAKVFPLIEQIRSGAAAVEATTLSLGDLSPAIRDTSKAFSDEIIQLTLQNTLLEEGERAVYSMTLRMQGFTDEQVKAALAIYDKNKALEQQKEEYKELSKEIDEYHKMGQQFIDEDEKRQEQLAKERERLRGQAMKVGATPLEDIEMRYQAEYDLLVIALEKEAITKEEYAQREVALTKEKVDAINRYNAQQIKNQGMFTDTQGQMLGALGNTFGTFAQSMDKSNKESFEKQKKFAIAQALINTLLSISYAMANPWPLNLALSAAAAISGAATVAQINSQQFSGAREMGGPVSAGNTYRVGERGNEAFITNSGQVMFTPSENGQIVSNKDLFGQQQQQSQPINISFYATGSIDKDFESFIINNQDLIYSSVSAAKSENGEMF